MACWADPRFDKPIRNSLALSALAPAAPNPPAPMTNPFGHADHRPFAGFGVELVFGTMPDGSIVGIKEVPSGLACDCVCPACGRRLVARKGPKTADHFAHYGKGSGCGLGLETNAHLWAKQVLERRKAIYLPAIRARIGAETLERMKPTRFAFDSVRLERRLGEMVPDVILTKQGHDLIVEVFVTHRCDEAKLAKIRATGVSVMEVDLHRYRTSQDEKAIERAMLKDAPRVWLFNPHVDQTEAILRDQIAERAKAKADAQRARAKNLLRALYGAEDTMTAALKAERDQAIGLGRKAQVLGTGHPEGFTVPPSIWRSALYMRLVLPPVRGERNDGFDAAAAMTLIPDCLAPGWARPLYGPLAGEVKALVPSLVHPEQTVGAYLEALSWAGVLRDLEGGYYGVATAEVIRVRDHLTAVRDTARRRQEACRRLDALLAGLPEADRKSFDLERWLEAPIEGFAATFDALAAAGGPEWDRFLTLVRHAERMLEGAAPAKATLGLPLQGEVDRSTRQLEILAEEEARRRREQLAQEAAARVAALKAAATSLGEDAERWLAQVGGASGLSMTDLARRDDAGACAAHGDLARVIDERNRLARAATATAQRRDQLRREALKVYDNAHAGVFLNSGRHELGGRSPWAACEDEPGLRDSLRLLPAKRRRGGL